MTARTPVTPGYPTRATVEPSADPTSITPSAAPTTTGRPPAGTDTPSPAGAQRALVAAAQTSIGPVDGTIFSVYREAGGWEVHVVSSDGTESEVGVSLDGTSILSGPTPDPDDADDADDLAERQQLLRSARSATAPPSPPL